MTVPTIRVVKADGLAGLVRRVVTNDVDGVRAYLASVFGNVREVRQLSDGSWPTIDRKPWLSYHWVAWADSARQPDSTVGAQPGDRFVGNVEEFLPGTASTSPDSRVASLTETFGLVANGAAWPVERWRTGMVPTDGGATVQSEVGQLRSGYAGAYATTDAASMVMAQAAAKDMEILFDVILPEVAGAEVRVYGRCAEANLNIRTGLVLTVSTAGLRISDVFDWAFRAPIASSTSALSPGSPYRVRFVAASQADGTTTMRARVWSVGATEPTTWDVVGKSTITAAAGDWGFWNPGSSAASTSSNIQIDNVRTYTQAPASNPEWWAAA